MSVLQLDAVRPRQTLQTFQRLIAANYKQFRRTTLKTQRSARTWIRNQYMLSHAVADSRKAFYRNEDIILGCFIVIAVLNFSASSVLANTLYLFMVTAAVLSELSGVSLLILVVLAFGVVAISIVWLGMFMQNLLAIGFMEGMTGKRRKSLRITLRRSLAQTPQMTIAWILVLLITTAPILLASLVLAVFLYYGIISEAGIVPAIIVFTTAAVAWMSWAVMRYSLMPYIVLFERNLGYKAALVKSRQLVGRRGKFFILSGYGFFITMLVALYGIAILSGRATGLDHNIVFLTLGVIPVTWINIIFTTLYRKRKLARN